MKKGKLLSLKRLFINILFYLLVFYINSECDLYTDVTYQCSFFLSFKKKKKKRQF